MALDINKFSGYTGDTRVQFQNDDVVRSQSQPTNALGKLWNWMTRSAVEKQTNTETAQQFIATIKEKYGDQVGNLVTAGLAGHVEKGKPLTGRRIQAVIDQAEQLKAQLQPPVSQQKNQVVDDSPPIKKQEPIQPKKMVPPDPQEMGVKKAMGFQYAMMMQGIPESLKQYGLTRAEATSIYAYTTSDRFLGYTPINNTLRSVKSDQDSLGPLEPMIKAAIEGIDKLPDHRGPVYRTLNAPLKSEHGIEIMSQYQVGAKVTEKGFTSTTYDIPPKIQGGDFSGRYHFLIESEHGKKVDEISAHPNEKEVLFKPLTQFEVTDRIEGLDGSVLIKMKEVPNDDK